MSLDLKKKLEERIKKAREVIASKNGTIARAMLDLEDLDRATARIEKERVRRLSKSNAKKVLDDSKSTPDEVPAVAAPQKKKSQWGGLVPFGD